MYFPCSGGGISSSCMSVSFHGVIIWNQLHICSSLYTRWDILLPAKQRKQQRLIISSISSWVPLLPTLATFKLLLLILMVAGPSSGTQLPTRVWYHMHVLFQCWGFSACTPSPTISLASSYLVANNFGTPLLFFSRVESKFSINWHHCQNLMFAIVLAR